MTHIIYTMEVTLHLSGPNASFLTDALREDLFNSDLEQLEDVYRQSEPPKEGELGHTWLEILNLVFTGSSFMLALVAFILGWRRDRNEDIEITVDVKGKSITISGKDDDEILKKAQELENKLKQE